MSQIASSATVATCPECGQTPMGSGCYHICPNSIYFYSPEQERYDDAHYGCDRYDGWGDPDLYADADEAYEAEQIVEDVSPFVVVAVFADASDLPF